MVLESNRLREYSVRIGESELMLGDKGKGTKLMYLKGLST